MTTTLRFEELKDKMKVYMVLPWWSPNFLPATVTENKDGFHIEINRKVQGCEYHLFAMNQDSLDNGYFIISRPAYKKDEDKACECAKKHAEHLLKLSGRSSWND